MTHRPEAALAVLLLVVAAILAGCGVGAGSPEGKISDATDTYLRALASGDTAKACAQLSGSARKRLGGPCAQEMQKIASRIGADALSDAADEGVDIEVEGTRGIATVRQLNARLELVQSGERWQIDSGYELNGTAN